jgi:benzoyl-CoA reductase/2-hydroxyglutaryl-CoA dehydratase subunit BcrC/BadD/HgdB
MGEQITSKQLLDHYAKKVYQDAVDAKARGELIGWSTAVVPQEFFEAMGLKLIYPENHSAVTSARKRAMEFLESAEAYGYHADICGYMRVNFGYLLKGARGDADVPQAPPPDFVVCCNNYCAVIVKWYENLAKELQVPLIMIDMPFNHDDEVDEARMLYIKAQFERLVEQLEHLTGRKFDEGRFREVMEISCENVRWWKKVSEFAGIVPAPLNGFDFYNYLTLMVFMRGRPETTEVLRRWVEEMGAKAKRGEGPFKDTEEKYRIMFDGIACWPQLAHTARALRSYGINITGSNYPDVWTVEYDAGDIEGMARAYATVANNLNLERQVEKRVQIIKAGKCDGVVYHMNRSCKVMDFLTYELQRRVFEKTAVPYMTFDGDQADPRVFVPAQFDTRLQALVEIMESKKSRGGEDDGES